MLFEDPANWAKKKPGSGSSSSRSTTVVHTSSNSSNKVITSKQPFESSPHSKDLPGLNSSPLLNASSNEFYNVSPLDSSTASGFYYNNVSDSSEVNNSFRYEFNNSSECDGNVSMFSDTMAFNDSNRFNEFSCESDASFDISSFIAGSAVSSSPQHSVTYQHQYKVVTMNNQGVEGQYEIDEDGSMSPMFMYSLPTGMTVQHQSSNSSTTVSKGHQQFFMTHEDPVMCGGLTPIIEEEGKLHGGTVRVKNRIPPSRH